MTFTKKELITILQEIYKETNKPIDDYITDVIENDIPGKTIKFINLHKPLSDLGVFNLIYNKRHKTPLFNNFTKRNIDEYEKMVCLGSLFTQMLCYIKTTKDNAIKHTNIVGANSILSALSNYINTNSFIEINKVYDEFSNIFKDLYIKKDGDNT